MSASFTAVASTRTGRIALVIGAFVVAFVADLAVGASWPGRIAVFALAASAVLVIGAKSLGSAFVSRPVGSRPGELGDPLDDLEDADEKTEMNEMTEMTEMNGAGDA